jgi:hypothetical protein
MHGPFGRLFMNCVGRAHCVLKPVDEDADFLADAAHKHNISIGFLFKAKKTIRKVWNTIPVLF